MKNGYLQPCLIRVEQEYMQEIMSKTYKAIFTLLAITAICSCGEITSVAEKGRENSSVKNQEEACSFQHARVRGTYCRPSIYGLLADPAKFFGREVFTYGYFIKNIDGTYALYPNHPSMKVNDFASCIRVAAIDPENSAPAIEEGKVYSAAIAGKFSKTEDYICSGEFNEAKIAELIPED